MEKINGINYVVFSIKNVPFNNGLIERLKTDIKYYDGISRTIERHKGNWLNSDTFSAEVLIPEHNAVSFSNIKRS